LSACLFAALLGTLYLYPHFLISKVVRAQRLGFGRYMQRNRCCQRQTPQLTGDRDQNLLTYEDCRSSPSNTSD
ncbi:hypothetical protein XENOCAPTIV_026623, partial [Xenoophorus captivus]